MRRIFSAFAVIVASLILLASGGIYWYCSSAVYNSYQAATVEVAQGLAAEITAQLDFLQKSTDGVAQSVDVIAALSSGNTTAIRNAEDKLQTLIPNALRVRLLLPTVSEPEQTLLPHMGFGDLEMVRSTLANPQNPVIQGENEHRHLAFTAPVIRDQQVIGVVLVSVKPNLVQQIVSKSQFAYGYLEVKQDQVLLASHGNEPDNPDELETIILANGRWKLNYSASARQNSIDGIVVVALISIPCSLAFLALFFGYRKLSSDLKQDQSSILKATKDMLMGKKLGSYPMQVDEMRPLINTLAQFKRVIELESVVPSQNIAGNYVFDESFDLDFDDLTPTSTRDNRIENVANTKTMATTQVKMPLDAIKPTSMVSDIGPTLAETAVTTVKPGGKSKSSKSKNKTPPITAAAPEALPTTELILPTSAADNWGFELKEISPGIPDSWDMDIQPTKVAKRSSVSAEIGPTSISPTSMRISETAEATAVATTKADIFRAYDIRGVVEQDLTPELVTQIGRAFASEARQKGVRTVVVGRDGRLSSAMLAEALILGLNASGCDVLDIGLVPTPLLYFVTQHSEGRTGVMVTGSHNPPEYNGLKLVLSGEVIGGEGLLPIKQRIQEESFVNDGIQGAHEQNLAIADEYIGMIADETNINRPLTVVLDCGNGAAGKIAPELLKAMGCEVVELFCEIDGNFPNHHPDPSKPENLKALIQAVKQHQADVGIALDGDGDRLGLVDSRGNIILPDRFMMLFARDILSVKPGAEILYDVKCSKHLADQIAKRGGRATMVRTGHANMRRQVKQTGAALAGELSGHVFFNDRWFGFDDGIYAAARMLELLSIDMRSSADLFSELPNSINTPEILVTVAEGENLAIVEQAVAKADFPDAKIITLDGLRVEFDEGWGLVRASNTLPALTLRFEADSQEALKRIQKYFKDLLLTISPQLNLPF